MTGFKDHIKKLKLVRKASRLSTRTVVAVCGGVCVCALVVMGLTLNKVQRQTRDLRARAAELERENRVLEEWIENADSVQGVRDIAQAELGLVDPGTITFQANP